MDVTGITRPQSQARVLSLDLDWAPPEVLADCLGLLDQAGIRATIFLTDAPEHPAVDGHDIGLHPNAKPQSSLLQTFDLLAARYPGARGVRSHGLETSGLFQAHCADKGIHYTSNYLHFLQPDIRPLIMPFGLWELPIFFSDATALRFQETHGLWPTAAAMLQGDGLKVFCFHPVHVFINSFGFAHYAQAKADYHDPARLRRHRRSGPGVRQLFQELVTVLGPGDHSFAPVMQALREDTVC